MLTVLPHCFSPPPFATYFQEKEGGGVTTRTCGFASLLSPPPPTNSHTEINKTLLCSRRRDLFRSTCHGSTEGWKSCWPRTCCHFFCKTQQVVSQPDSSHRPRDSQQDDAQNHWLHASGNCPRSVKIDRSRVKKIIEARLQHATERLAAWSTEEREARLQQMRTRQHE